MRDDIYLKLILLFAPLSLTAFGGGISVITAMEHQTVDVNRWLTSSEFLGFFAIARAAPGPGSMITTLIGWKVAGMPGAIVATAAMFIPSAILCVVIGAIWKAYRGRQWLETLERAVAPVGAGLLSAAVASIAQSVATTPTAIGVGVASTVVCFLRPTVHPLVIVFGAAAINALIFLALARLI